MIELVARPHARNLVRWAENRPEVVVLSADLTGSCEIEEFQRAYPDRFFSMGMAEQNMLGFAGGLAREGFTPFLHTFAVFLYRRAYDQLAMAVAYPNLRVRLLGFLPGIISPGGVTHQAIEDLAVLRGLPNLTILECGDATEVESVLDVAQAVPGPVYVRMLRGDVPRLFDPAEPDGPGTGADARARDRRDRDLQRHLHGGGVAGDGRAAAQGRLDHAPARLDAQALRRPGDPGGGRGRPSRRHHDRES